MDGFDLSDPVNAWYWNETDFQQRLATTPALSELKGADYSAVFFAGGHGTMWDFRDNQDAQRIIREVYESDGIVSAVCHGPAALVDAKLSSGEYLIKGKNVAAFTNKEEEEVHTTDVVPFLLETALREHGALYHEAPNWSENVVTDDRLITGQNPASAHGVGVALLNALRRTALLIHRYSPYLAGLSQPRSGLFSGAEYENTTSSRTRYMVLGHRLCRRRHRLW